MSVHGPRAQAKLSCSLPSIASLAITVMLRRRVARYAHTCVPGSRTVRFSDWMVLDYATAANAALASALMRSIIERRPFERCGVRFSRKPMLLNSASASSARISLAFLPE